MTRLAFLTLLLILSVSAMNEDDGIQLNATQIEKQLEEEIIPRFQKHIERINLRQPKIKHDLEIKVRKIQKSLNKIKKRIEEIKVNMQRSINKMEVQDKQRKEAIKKYQQLKKAKAMNQMKIAKKEVDAISKKCMKTENRLRRMQLVQHKLVKTAERMTRLLRLKRENYNKSDHLRDIRVKRNKAKIVEITHLIKKYKNANLLVKHIRETLEAKKNSGNLDDEYDNLRRRARQCEKKESVAAYQLEDMLKAMNVRADAKSKFKEVKNVLSEKVRSVKNQLRRDKSILRKVTIKRNIMKRQKQRLRNPAEKQRVRDSIKQINRQLIGLKKRVQQNSYALRGLKRKMNRATLAYNSKKRTIESRISRQRMLDLKDERMQLRRTIRSLKRRYTKVERRVLLAEDEPEKIDDLKKRMGEIQRDLKANVQRFNIVKEKIHRYFVAVAKRRASRMKRMTLRQSMLEKRLVVLKRIRAINEKKLTHENSSPRRKIILRKIKGLNRRIRFISRRLRIMTNRLRHITIVKGRKNERKVILYSRKVRLLKKRLARLQIRRQKYNSSDRLLKLIPQVNRLEQETKEKLQRITSVYKKAEEKANILDAEIREIQRMREIESSLKSKEIKKRMHVTEAKLRVLNGRKGSKIDDMKKVLRMKVNRMRSRVRRVDAIRMNRKRRIGISRLNKVLEGGFNRLKKVVIFKKHIGLLNNKIEQAQQVINKLSNIIADGKMKETINIKLDQLRTSINMLTLKRQKLEFLLKKAATTLLRTTAIVKGVAQATVEAHQVHHAQLIVNRDKLEKSIERHANGTFIETERNIERRNHLDELNKHIKESAMSIDEVRIQSAKFAKLTLLVTDGIDDTVEKKGDCELCTTLARIMLQKKKYDGLGAIKTLKHMDRVCNKSKYPTTCYKTLISLGSQIFEQGVTPLSVCRGINKC